MKRKRRYVFAVLTFFGTLTITAGNCFKGKKSRESDEEPASAPMFPGMTMDSNAGKGEKHLRWIYSVAASNLRSRKVMSKAFPRKCVADVIPSDVLMTIPIIEHIDPVKIRREGPEAAVRDVLSVIGRNGPSSYAATRSRVGAHGLFQYMPKTSSGIRRK